MLIDRSAALKTTDSKSMNFSAELKLHEICLRILQLASFVHNVKHCGGIVGI